MRPVRSLVVYALLVFLGGALLAPWLYWSVQGLGGHFPALRSLAQQPFHRYVHRSMLGLALLGLVPLLRGLGLRRWRDAGLVSPKGNGRRLAAGLALGFTSLACVAVAALATGARVPAPGISAGRLAGSLAGALASAAVVSVLEEVLFRGAIFGALRRSVSLPAALVGSGAIYALVHFFSRPESSAAAGWASGLAVLGQMLGGLTDAGRLVPGFFNLTLAGAALALGYERTGNLYFSIGLHAGWIFWLKIYGALTREAGEAAVAFWGTGRLIDGWLALPALAAALALLGRCLPRADSPEIGGGAG